MIQIKIAVLDGEVKTYILEGPMQLCQALRKLRVTIDFASQIVTLNGARIVNASPTIDHQDRILVVNRRVDWQPKDLEK